jgi:hypothetical protein
VTVTYVVDCSLVVDALSARERARTRAHCGCGSAYRLINSRTCGERAASQASDVCGEEGGTGAITETPKHN